MKPGEDQFEERLRAGLSRLAEDASGAPTAQDVRRRLSRRAFRRGLAACAAAAGLIACASVLWVADGPTRPGTGAGFVEQSAPVGRPQTPVAAGAPAPLRVGAGSKEVRKALERYLVSRGVEGGIYLEKTPEAGLSYAVASKQMSPGMSLGEDLERMFQDFELAAVWMWDGHLTYTLLSPGREAGAL